jgi:cytochrome c553
MNKWIMFVAAVLVQAGLASTSQAADLENGKKLVTEKICVTCHGANLNTPIDPTYPKLAGQHADYLAHALHAYKIDDKPLVGRVHAIMGAQAKGLNDKEISDIAAYIASLPGNLVLEK